MFSVLKESIYPDSMFKLDEAKKYYNFRYVEMITNFRVFLADIAYETNNPDYPIDGHRYIFTSIEHAISQAQCSNVIKNKISVLLTREDSSNDEYITTELKKVVEAKDERDHKLYILYCNNNNKYYEPGFNFDESKLHGQKVIYLAKPNTCSNEK